MNWTKVKEFYGLRPPFNFRIAIPFLLSICLLSVTFVTCALLFFRGDLSIGTARFYFFLYIACFLFIAALFSRISKLSYTLLVWCIIELGLGLGNHFLVKRSGPSLFPENGATTDGWSLPFVYHPLLQSVPRPSWHYTDRVDFADMEDEAKAAGVDVPHLQNQELVFVHNSLGFRGKEPSADDLAKDLIFVYGGSTTYDVGVTQGETWVEHLQSDLKNKYTFLNLGVPGYNTAEHLIQTAFYQDIVGKKPVCAVYYVGWNDADEGHIEHPDSAYADFHLFHLAERRPLISLAKYSPLLLLANGLAVKRFDTLPLPVLMRKAPVAPSNEHLEAIFAEHIKTIVAINEARGIKTIFIGQIFNPSWPANPPERFLPFVSGETVVPLVKRLKSVLKDTSASVGTMYIDPGITNFAGGDFVDSLHFAARGSRKFAALVSKQVGDYCQ